MSIPDYISPIVGYRAWTWNTLGLRSLSGTLWRPGQPQVARCRASTVVGRSKANDDVHDAPHEGCTCGIYATKTLHHFRSARYDRYGIHGEVYLWGTVVEHELGYRAQFAYPKNFVLPADTLPFTSAAIEARPQGLIAFGIHIFVGGPTGTSLCGRSIQGGPNGAGLLNRDRQGVLCLQPARQTPEEGRPLGGARPRDSGGRARQQRMDSSCGFEQMHINDRPQQH